MPNFSGNWKMKSSENFEELLKALGEWSPTLPPRPSEIPSSWGRRGGDGGRGGASPISPPNLLPAQESRAAVCRGDPSAPPFNKALVPHRGIRGIRRDPTRPLRVSLFCASVSPLWWSPQAWTLPPPRSPAVPPPHIPKAATGSPAPRTLGTAGVPKTSPGRTHCFGVPPSEASSRPPLPPTAELCPWRVGVGRARTHRRGWNLGGAGPGGGPRGLGRIKSSLPSA